MEFFVTCLIGIIDFVLIGISFIKGHQVKFQNHHLSVISNLCLHFFY